MTRLCHSYAGYLRYMQMSATHLHVFVEGKQCDPFFFSKICDVSLDSHIKYKVTIAVEIPGDSGGKQSLLNFFSYLRSRKSLFTNLQGKKTSCVFFLDKDIDDLQRKTKRSPHIIYTKYYDVQNHIFENGDLVTGCAAAASIDFRKLIPHLANPSLWCKNMVAQWKEWIALCLRLIEDGILCEANYRVISRVQARLCEPTNLNSLNTLIQDIAARNNVPIADLNGRIKMSVRKVDRYIKRGEHHRIFKGKWFGIILSDDIDRIMAGEPYDNNSLANRLPSAIAATIDFSGHWAKHFTIPLQNVADML